MLIRKNHLPNSSSYHQLIRYTEYEEDHLKASIVQSQTPDYRTFDTQDLVLKIQQQQGQIQKLLNIIDKYKCKIQEFQQYEEVIKDFLARKQQQNHSSNPKNTQKLQIHPCLSSKSSQSSGPFTKSKKQSIVPSYSVTILCQNQRTSKQGSGLQISSKFSEQNLKKWASQKYQTPQKTSLYFPDSKGEREDQKQNRQYRTNYKQRNAKEALVKKVSKSFVKLKSNFDVSHSIRFLDESDYMEQMNRRSIMQRVPSVNNMRRIEKCFKLLKG